MTRTPFPGLCIIDADTHLTEPHDLWTSRAPKGYEDRVPQVRDVDGVPTWTIEGRSLSRAGASGVVGADGVKVPGTTFFQWNIDDVHRGAYEIEPRLAMMDEQGIWAQIVYPNTVGFGGQKFVEVGDEAAAPAVGRALQRRHGRDPGVVRRPALPDGDPALAGTSTSRSRETERCAAMGLPRRQHHDRAPRPRLPDLGDEHWDPMWEACAALGLPVQLPHRRERPSLSWFGSAAVAVADDDQKLGHRLGDDVPEQRAGDRQHHLLRRARALPRAAVRVGRERHRLDPVLPEALDYQPEENAPSMRGSSTCAPSEYFRRQIYSCFWFERTRRLPRPSRAVGEDNIMFETDFPHPTCLYPDGLEYAAAALAGVEPDATAMIMGLNAGRLVPTSRCRRPEGRHHGRPPAGQRRHRQRVGRRAGRSRGRAPRRAGRAGGGRRHRRRCRRRARRRVGRCRDLPPPRRAVGSRLAGDPGRRAPRVRPRDRAGQQRGDQHEAAVDHQDAGRRVPACDRGQPDRRLHRYPRRRARHHRRRWWQHRQRLLGQRVRRGVGDRGLRVVEVRAARARPASPPSSSLARASGSTRSIPARSTPRCSAPACRPASIR